MNTAAIRIRPASAEDCPWVAELYAGYVLSSLCTFELVPPSGEEWRARLARVEQLGLPFLVALAGEELLGYAYLTPWRERPGYRFTVEDSVYVAPLRHGQGVGRRLMAELLLRAKAWGARQVVAVVADSGEPASLQLHLRLGFREAGRLSRVGFKLGRWVDTRLLQLSLEQGEATPPDREPLFPPT
jgi:L-amino acid N-acyltransferase YncA